MSEIRLPPNNVNHHTTGEEYDWHVVETGSKTLRIVKRFADGTDRVYPEFTGFQDLREAFVRFFNLRPTNYVYVGDIGFYFDESLVDNKGSKFCTRKTVYRDDVPIWAIKWLHTDEIVPGDKAYTGFFATMDDYRAIKRWQYPLPLKFTVVGGSTDADWFYHAHARDYAQMRAIAFIALTGGWPRIFDGHLKSGDPENACDNPEDHTTFYHCALGEVAYLTKLADNKATFQVRPEVQQACKDKLVIVNEYLTWYRENHTTVEIPT